MIKLIDTGHYRLVETKNQTKMLTLINDETLVENVYAWITVAEIGELLVSSYSKHTTDNILALGKYRLYDVKNEPDLTDLYHLELLVGQGIWQGYLLLHGLPIKGNIKRRIIPTDEVITKSS